MHVDMFLHERLIYRILYIDNVLNEKVKLVGHDYAKF